MAQGESKLSRDIMRALRIRSWFCFKVHGSEHMMAGLPDIIVCVEGLFVGLETKMPGKESNTSARQDYVHEQIRNCKGKVYVISSVEEAVQVCADVAAAGRAAHGSKN